MKVGYFWVEKGAYAMGLNMKKKECLIKGLLDLDSVSISSQCVSHEMWKRFGLKNRLRIL